MMLQQKGLYRPADHDADKQQGYDKTRYPRRPIRWNRPLLTVVIVHEPVDLPITGSKPWHGVGVEHDWLASIDIHGAPRRLR
jgi:hypothetical protein